MSNCTNLKNTRVPQTRRSVIKKINLARRTGCHLNQIMLCLHVPEFDIDNQPRPKSASLRIIPHLSSEKTFSQSSGPKQSRLHQSHPCFRTAQAGRASNGNAKNQHSQHLQHGIKDQSSDTITSVTRVLCSPSPSITSRLLMAPDDLTSQTIDVTCTRTRRPENNTSIPYCAIAASHTNPLSAGR